MNRLQGNKIFAAILVALITSLLASMIADGLVEPHVLKQNVFKVTLLPDSAPSSAGAPQEDKINDIKPFLAKASASEGEKSAKKCLQCHVFEKGGANKIGPHLYGIVGSKQGKQEGFAYSSAFQKLDKEWTVDELSHFLYNPRKYVPGNKMSFLGLKDDQERANVIAYLETLK